MSLSLNHGYENTQIDSTCPICCSKTGYMLYEVDNISAAKNFIQQEVNEQKFLKLCIKIEELWKKKVCYIVRCTDCNFVYSNPYLAGDPEFYNLAFSGDGYPKDKWEFNITAAIINEYVKNINLSNSKNV